MVESRDKGFGLLVPTEFDEQNPINPKYNKKEELELQEINRSINISNVHGRLSDEEYISRLKKYVDDIIELSKTNPELAKELARKALIDTGVLDEYGNSKDGIVEYSSNTEQPQKLVKKLKKYSKK